MTLTEFDERLREALGPARAAQAVRDHHLTRFGGRTAAAALDDGESVKEVWLALCADFDVPEPLR